MKVALLVVILCALLNPERFWNLQDGTEHPQQVPTVTFTRSWSNRESSVLFRRYHADGQRGL
jgi:hypothetical protein